MSLENQVRVWTEKVEGDLDLFTQKVTLEIFNEVLRRTRVDTGVLRFNWQVSQNTPATASLLDKDPNPGQPLRATEAAKIQGLSLNILTNNVIYARYREEADGMVAAAVANFHRWFEEEIQNS